MQNKSFIKRFLESLTALLSADALPLILMALFSIVFGRTQGTEKFGLFSISFVVATITYAMVEAGYEFRISREVASNPESTRQLIEEAAHTRNAIFIVCLIPATGLGYLISDSFVFLILLGWAAARSASSGLKAALRGMGHMRAIAAVELRSTIILYLVNFSLIFFFPDLSLIFIMFFLTELYKSFDYHRKTAKNSEIPPWSTLFRIKLSALKDRKRLGHQFRLVSVNVLSVVHYRSAMIIIGSAGTASMVGIYSAGMRFLTFLRVIPGTSLNVLLPEYSSPGNKKSDIRSGFMVAVASGAAISAGLWAAAPFLMSITFNYPEAVPVLKILAWSFLPIFINHTSEALLLSENRESAINRALSVSAVSIMTAAAVVVPRFGAVGAAWCALGGEILLFLIYTITIARKRKN
jgi:O-antigen/teichoic acid export membrane protein